MLFRQLFHQESATYSYLIGCRETRQAAIIDPVNTEIESYSALLESLGLTLRFALDTHLHADHVTATGLLKKRFGCDIGVSALCGANNPDIHICDGDVFDISPYQSLKALSTPGHTKGSVCFLWQDRLFTGDTLLIGGCGRTDFQGGSAEALYDSITNVLFNLPDDTLVYPGHDYNNHFVSTIAQERLTNPRIANKTKSEFIKTMSELELPYPKLIDIAVPANRECGLV